MSSTGARSLVLILQLCDKLAAPRPDYGSVAAWLGIDGIDPRLPPPNAAGPPADPALAHAIVAASPASSMTTAVELWLAEPDEGDAGLAAAALRAALGGQQAVPRALVRSGEPAPLVFAVHRGGRKLRVIAAEEDGRIVRVKVER